MSHVQHTWYSFYRQRVIYSSSHAFHPLLCHTHNTLYLYCVSYSLCHYSTHLPTMSRTQCQIANELGYDLDVVKAALRKQRFKTAGDLVDYLWEHELDSPLEEEDICVEKSSSNTEENPTVIASKLSNLRLETTRLYLQSKCMNCRDRGRAIVILPCCHFVLCIPCAPKCKVCPYKDCNTPIKNTIVTYLS